MGFTRKEIAEHLASEQSARYRGTLLDHLFDEKMRAERLARERERDRVGARERAAETRVPNPLAVTCPSCRQLAGHPCRSMGRGSQKGRAMKMVHAARAGQGGCGYVAV